MKQNIFFIFLFLFSLVFVLGCTDFGGGTGELGPETTSHTIERGNINATISINGKLSNEVELVGLQTAEISLKLKNGGQYPMKSLDTVEIAEIQHVKIGAVGRLSDQSNVPSIRMHRPLHFKVIG